METIPERLKLEVPEHITHEREIPISLVVPIDPEALNRQMQAVSPRLRGSLKIPNYRLSITVPAGIIVEIPFPLPSGFTCTRRSPLSFTSTYYSPDITIDIYCDGEKINPYPMPLTGGFDVDFGTYYVKRKRVDIIFTNNSVSDATITFQVIPHIIRDRLYDEWYEPLVNTAYDLLTTLSERRRIVFEV